jgi:hypothetical protein
VGKPFIVVELPEELYDEAISEGLGHRYAPRWLGAADVITMVVGLGGGAIALMQAPETINRFWAWLTRRLDSDEARLHVPLQRDGRSVGQIDIRCDGETVITLASDIDAGTVLQLLLEALREDT